MDDELSFLFDTSPELNFRGDRLDYLFRLEEGVEGLSFDPLNPALRLHALAITDAASRAFPEIEGPWERERRYFGEHLEKLTKRSPQSLSDYRQAGRIYMTYKSELETLGVDGRVNGIIKKLLALPEAIKNHSETEEVFLLMAELSTREYQRYARGEDISSPSGVSDLERYLDGLD